MEKISLNNREYKPPKLEDQIILIAKVNEESHEILDGFLEKLDSSQLTETNFCVDFLNPNGNYVGLEKLLSDCEYKPLPFGEVLNTAISDLNRLSEKNYGDYILEIRRVRFVNGST